MNRRTRNPCCRKGYPDGGNGFWGVADRLMPGFAFHYLTNVIALVGVVCAVAFVPLRREHTGLYRVCRRAGNRLARTRRWLARRLHRRFDRLLRGQDDDGADLFMVAENSDSAASANERDDTSWVQERLVGDKNHALAPVVVIRELGSNQVVDATAAAPDSTDAHVVAVAWLESWRPNRRGANGRNAAGSRTGRGCRWASKTHPTLGLQP